MRNALVTARFWRLHFELAAPLLMRLEILSPAQRAFWEEDAGSLPPGWVLYRGTAIALQLGHRHSLEERAAQRGR